MAYCFGSCCMMEYFLATITRFLPSSIADNYVGVSYPQTLASAIRNSKLLLTLMLLPAYFFLFSIYRLRQPCFALDFALHFNPGPIPSSFPSCVILPVLQSEELGLASLLCE